MNRSQLELNRLYGLGADSAGIGHTVGEHDVRVLVLELKQPASWQELSSAWQGVQADLELPAPAIAVSGVDALQLWFAFASPISPSDGALFLEGLRTRYLSQVARTQVRLAATTAQLPAAPPLEVGLERWSAFISPDLASVFADAPWLDVPPGDEGQATLLRALEPMKRDAFEAALAQLRPTGDTEPGEPALLAPRNAHAARGSAGSDADPVRFLVGVMNDETAPLALRIEAAKALLHKDGRE